MSALLAALVLGQPRPAAPVQARILAAARQQLVKPANYDASYQRLSYPGGDVPADRGACTDVIIRALRAVGKDLQVLIHEDMARVAYPRGGRRDRNIDHRRVVNQVLFFQRFGERLSMSTKPADMKNWRPGNFVVWKLPSGLDHIGIVTDRWVNGRPMVIHNIWQTAEEDVLLAYRIVGHYRYPVR